MHDKEEDKIQSVFEVPADLLLSIVNYLSKHPYNQVANLIDPLKQLKPERKQICEGNIDEKGREKCQTKRKES